jgi:transcriptional accessory protein Tex/SPT6
VIFFHRCELIALGNGTACRETESYLSDLVKNGWFYPLDVKFTIISEQGTSIYSCSPVAQKEFPGIDPVVISAGNHMYILGICILLRV